MTYDCLRNYFYYSLSCLLVLIVLYVVLLFAMIINLLMWAEARGSRGQQGNGDSAA